MKLFSNFCKKDLYAKKDIFEIIDYVKKTSYKCNDVKLGKRNFFTTIKYYKEKIIFYICNQQDAKRDKIIIDFLINRSNTNNVNVSKLKEYLYLNYAQYDWYEIDIYIINFFKQQS